MLSSSVTSASSWSVMLILCVAASQYMVVILNQYYIGTAVLSSPSAICGERRLKIISEENSILSGLLLPQGNQTKSDNGPVVIPVQKQPDPPADLSNEYEGIYARAFDYWGDKPLPCHDPSRRWKDDQAKQSRKGFLFVKLYKTGSSTAAGINLRIARNVAKRLNTGYEICKPRSDHVEHAYVKYGDRYKEQSFLWTMLREPTSRVVSQFFHFQVSRDKREPTDAIFKDYVLNGRQMVKDYYLKTLALQPSWGDPVAEANEIIAGYDFIGITERMDESAVAIAMLLGIPISDILYLTAKGHGGFDDGGGRDEKICTFIWPSFRSPGMQKVLDSEKWKANSRWDRALYQAANRSLDLTIEKLGRLDFMRNLRLYKQAQERGREFCLHKTRFPCSIDGVFSPPDERDCLWLDSACGSDCLDEVTEELNMTMPYAG